MKRYLSLLFLDILLVCGGVGCAARLNGPTQPSGYFFSVIVSAPQIYLLVNHLFERLQQFFESLNALSGIKLTRSTQEELL